MEITAQQANELRKQTGVGMLACKKALEEAEGDTEKAIELLRKRGETKAAEKSERSTSQGAIALSGRAMVKILCETDFVAKNEKFIAFTEELAQKADKEGAGAAKDYFDQIKTDKIQEIGENIILDSVNVLDVEGAAVVGGYLHTNRKVATLVYLEGGTEEQARDIAMHATAMNPLVANVEDVPADLIEKEKEIATEQLIAAGKPEQIIEKILVGKIRKFCAERALVSQPFVKDPEKTVAQYLGDTKVVKFVRVEV